MRNYRELETFKLADGLVDLVYDWTESFPESERYGLRGQLRRAAVSVPTNLVEGSSRESVREYARFVEVALGSACETHYLVGLAERRRMTAAPGFSTLDSRYVRLCSLLRRQLIRLRTMK
jgi:four helix bundle protein